MIVRLVGISVWIGALLALLGLARPRLTRLDVVARRYSGVALIAFALVAVSGMGNTWVRLDSPVALWSTPYGGIMIRASLLVALGVIG